MDTLITIPNERLLAIAGKHASMVDAFQIAWTTCCASAVQGISDLITTSGLINVDFADVRTVMSEKGMALMGSRPAQRREPRGARRPGRDLQPAVSTTSASRAPRAS